jgi:hypothetical protein
VPWVKHPISGELEPPEVHWFLAEFIAINSKGCADAVMLKHARRFYGLSLALRGRSDNLGHEIKGKTRQRAERVDANRGAKNDLLRLQTAAKSNSAKVFQKAWLAVPGKTHSLIWSPAPPIVERSFDDTGRLVGFRRERPDVSKLRQVAVPGFSSLMPAAADALPLIEAAIRKLDAVPAAERRKRKPDYSVKDELVSAVAAAYRDLTGRKGVTGKPDIEIRGGLLDLGRKIDARFGTDIFTINRVRKNISDG